MKIFPLVITFFTIIFLFFLNEFFQYLSLFYLKFFNISSINFFIKKFYFDTFGSKIIAKYFLKISYNDFFKNLDRGIFEVFGPSSFIKISRKFNYYFLNFHSSIVHQYIFNVYLGIFVIVLLIFI